MTLGLYTIICALFKLYSNFKFSKFIYGISDFLIDFFSQCNCIHFVKEKWSEKSRKKNSFSLWEQYEKKELLK